jgi:hypothetical protein
VQVIVGANEGPVLNDVTIGELVAVLEQLRPDWPEVDAALRYPRHRL